VEWKEHTAKLCVQCESRENGPIVHSGIEKKNEKLSVCNITSRLRLNLPDSMSISPSHPIVKLCRVKRTPSNSGGSKLGIRSVSNKSFGLCGPSFDELVMFEPSLVLSSFSLAHRGFFMCSGQLFELPHGAIFGGTVMNFNGTSGTSWDQGRWTFDGDTWR